MLEEARSFPLFHFLYTERPSRLKHPGFPPGSVQIYIESLSSAAVIWRQPPEPHYGCIVPRQRSLWNELKFSETAAVSDRVLGKIAVISGVPRRM